MSIEALNWAMRQRLRGCPPQCLLYVLANAADPEGVAFRWWRSADHWWPYLIKHTRLARATIFTLLRELEADGLIFRETQVTPEDGSRAQSVIRLNFDKMVDVEALSERRGEAAPESESVTWTQRTERAAETDPESPLPGLVSPETMGLAPVAVHPMDSSESITWTGKESYKENQNTRLSPPTPSAPAAPPPPSSKEAGKPSRLDEPIGFASCFEGYLDWQAMDRLKGAAEFRKLSPADQKLAIHAAPLHAAHLRKINRKARNFHLWIRQRGFSSYAPGVSPQTGERVFAADGTSAAQAWANAYGVAFGNPPAIPVSARARQGNEMGALVPAPWPLGGEGWLAPLSDWVFVEQYCARFNRWSERVHEIFQRPMLATRFWSRADHNVRVFGRAPDGTLSEKNPMGAYVPCEWPPAKGEQARQRRHGADPPESNLSEEDADALINS